MSLTDKLKDHTGGLKRRLKQDARAGSRAASSRTATVKSKAGQDVRAGSRAAAQSIADLKAKARQDVRAGTRRARNIDRDDLKSAASAVGEATEGLEADYGFDTDDTAARAAENAEMGAPIGDATFDPVTSPEDMGNFVTGLGSPGADHGGEDDFGFGFDLGVDDMVTGSGGSGVDDMVTGGDRAGGDDEMFDWSWGGDEVDADDSPGWYL